jgi:hypothetical protein
MGAARQKPIDLCWRQHCGRLIHHQHVFW